MISFSGRRTTNGRRFVTFIGTILKQTESSLRFNQISVFLLKCHRIWLRAEYIDPSFDKKIHRQNKIRPLNNLKEKIRFSFLLDSFVDLLSSSEANGFRQSLIPLQSHAFGMQRWEIGQRNSSLEQTMSGLFWAQISSISLSQSMRPSQTDELKIEKKIETFETLFVSVSDEPFDANRFRISLTKDRRSTVFFDRMKFAKFNENPEKNPENSVCHLFDVNDEEFLFQRNQIDVA